MLAARRPAGARSRGLLLQPERSRLAESRLPAARDRLAGGFGRPAHGHCRDGSGTAALRAATRLARCRRGAAPGAAAGGGDRAGNGGARPVRDVDGAWPAGPEQGARAAGEARPGCRRASHRADQRSPHRRPARRGLPPPGGGSGERSPAGRRGHHRRPGGRARARRGASPEAARRSGCAARRVLRHRQPGAPGSRSEW